MRFSVFLTHAPALGLALSSMSGCDKLALPENVVPAEGTRPAAPATRDAGSGFMPDLDGGDSDGGTAESCGPAPDPNTPFSKRALLASIAQCTTRQYCLVQSLTQAFSEKASAYEASPDDATLEAAKNAWYFANEAWQVLELFRFGPPAATMDPGGKGLRDLVHPFPSFSRCSVEEQIVEQGYAADFEALAPGTRGLATAEFLLFSSDPNNSCSSFHGLNYPAPGKWASLTAEQIDERKRTYLAAVARDIHVRVAEIIASWSPDEGNFAQELASAGHGSNVYASEQAGLNAVSHALFYMDKEVKDWKVARPAGLAECTTTCQSYAESPYARVGSASVRANLKGFRLLFQGCGEDYAGLGFDDWLRAVGMGDVADDILAGLDASENAIAEVDLDKAFIEDPSRVMPVRDALKQITDVLKTDFLSALNLSLPMVAEGDND